MEYSSSAAPPVAAPIEELNTIHPLIEAGLSLRFGWADYCVFFLMLMVSASIGVYYGFFAKKNIVEYESGQAAGPTSDLEYLTGGRGLKPFPVAMSLVASYISGVTVVGTPAEIYYFGTQYWIIVVGIFFMGITVAFVYLPVFLNLNIISSYEYLELRFNQHVRAAACAMFVMDEIMFLPIVLYIPSIAFNLVTGINVHLIGTIVCAVCIFYTSVGGLKAVVWTDTLQILLMFFSVFVVVIVGLVNIGGFGVVWSEASKGGRLELFNFDPNPLERHTFWSLVVGGYIYWTAFNSVNQTMVQRYLALPTLAEAQIAMSYFTAGIIIFLSFCCYSGLLIYATYHDCDPLESKMINSQDQLLPLFVMKTARDFIGLPGLFIAGVFSAALSSLSTILNSTTGVIMKDLLESYFHVQFSSSMTIGIMARGLVVGLGLISICGIFIVEKLGGVLQVVYTLGSIAAGSTFGVFTLGITCPFANTKGALAGALSGALLIGWISVGSQAAAAAGKLNNPKLPVSIDACRTSQTINGSANLFSYVEFEGSPALNDTSIGDQDDVLVLYKLSYQWLTPLGFCAVMLVGSLVSLVTGEYDEAKLDPNLFTPLVRKWLLRRRRLREDAAKAAKDDDPNRDMNSTVSLELTSLDRGRLNSNGSPVSGIMGQENSMPLLKSDQGTSKT